MSASTDSSRLSWPQLAGAVAAAAGGAAWVSAIGSAVMGIRLANARMPVESTVALMSSEHRFAIGAGSLTAPLFVGLVGFLVDWVWIEDIRARRRRAMIGTRKQDGPSVAGKERGKGRALLTPRRYERALLAIAATVVGALIGLVVLQPPLMGQYVGAVRSDPDRCSGSVLQD